MSDEIIDKENIDEELSMENPVEGHSEYKPTHVKDESVKYQLTGMYQNWFLDYASYVILERAVPHINDGFKPVQRRILHSMKRLDDGRYNKVANIVGHTMQFHPHGDASIGDALVHAAAKSPWIRQFVWFRRQPLRKICGNRASKSQKNSLHT